MKKLFLVVFIAISLVFTSAVSSCSSGVSQQQYDELYDEVNTLRGEKAEATMYVFFLDTLMYQFYKLNNIPTNYEFASYDEWLQSLTRTADSMKDPKLTSLLDKVKKDPNGFMELANYVITHISTTLES